MVRSPPGESRSVIRDYPVPGKYELGLYGARSELWMGQTRCGASSVCTKMLVGNKGDNPDRNIIGFSFIRGHLLTEMAQYLNTVKLG